MEGRAYEDRSVSVEKGGGWGFFKGFLFETDKFEYFLSLRGFGKDLLIFNLFYISFFFDIRVKEFEKEVFIVYGFHPSLVIVAALVII